jgi:hypothetical protein
MKRFALILCLLTLPCAFAGIGGEDQEVPPVDIEEPIYTNVQTDEQHQAFLGLVQEIKTNPDYAGTQVGIRVNLEWELVDRRAEKKKPETGKAPGSETIDKLVGVANKATNMKGSVTITYTRITGYDAEGRPLLETFTISGGLALGGAAAAQAAMDEAMNKNHK